MVSELFHKYTPSSALFLSSDMHCKFEDLLELSQAMQRHKVSGKLVLSLVQNKPEALMGYIALLKSEAVQMLQSEDLSLSALSNLIYRFKPSFIWLPTERASELLSYEKLLEIGAYSLCQNDTNRTKIHPDLALLLSTSGSTGSPKCVRISKRNVLENAQAIAKFLRITSNDRPITTLPPSYTYGLSIVHSHLVAGAALIVSDKTFFDRSFWELFRELEATSLAGVPYQYEMLKKLKFSQMDLPSLKIITQAGGYMDRDLTREFAEICDKKGILFYSMYGQVEATSRISFLDPMKIRQKAGSIGRAIPGGKLWLRDETGAIIRGTEEIGELIYEGPNVCMGYASGHEDLIKMDLNLGVLATGDLAKKDEDGDYYIVGRKSRFLKFFGRRVNLQEVEMFLEKEGYVCGCTGEDDHLQIYVEGVNFDDIAVIKRKVLSFLKLASKACSVHHIAHLPRTKSGKIKYSDLSSSEKD
tara:strand:+ start:1405 stop:2820 length:1416 start_codon:yes stop_codon:yes gene_type:complete